MPGYEISYEKPDVSFFTVDTQNSGDSTGGSGQTVVANIFFNWESADGGFTGSGEWFTDIPGPTSTFESDQAVKDYLSTPGTNLNSYFEAWQNRLDSMSIVDRSNEVTNFVNALAGGGAGACMTET